MKRFTIQIFSIIFLASCTMDKPDVNPPITEQDDLVETLHGVEVADPYRWLEDFTSDRAATWEQLQNDYTAPVSYTHLTLPTNIGV